MTPATDTPTEATTGLQLPCPCCGQAEANIALELHDMQSFTCRECDAEFTRADIEALIARWQPVLAWIDTAPKAG